MKKPIKYGLVVIILLLIITGIILFIQKNKPTDIEKISSASSITPMSKKDFEKQADLKIDLSKNNTKTDKINTGDNN